jgi:probable HAF family extracellular repeat protein
MSGVHLRLAIVVLALLVPALKASGKNKTLFIELDSRSGVFPSAVTNNGAMVVGTFDGGGALYWMPTSGIIANGGSFATDVSADGLTIVGAANDARGIQNAAIWLRAAEWRLLGGFAGGSSCDAFLSVATGISRDGKVVVGHAYKDCRSVHAFRWEESTGMVDLGTALAEHSTHAEAVSADGRVIVGYQETGVTPLQGVRWVDGRQESFPGERGFVGTAYDVNRDGSVAVGRQCRPPTVQNPIDDQSAWIWSARDGTRCLPVPRFRPSPGPPVLGYANATSDDGRVVGGSQRIGQVDSDAIIWIDGSASYLKDYLRANGVPDAFEGWPNTGEITDVSADGRILLGWGAAPRGFRGYLVILGDTE